MNCWSCQARTRGNFGDPRSHITRKKHRLSRPPRVFPPVNSLAPELLHLATTWWWDWHDDVVEMIYDVVYMLTMTIVRSSEVFQLNFFDDFSNFPLHPLATCFSLQFTEQSLLILDIWHSKKNAFSQPYSIWIPWQAANHLSWSQLCDKVCQM